MQPALYIAQAVLGAAFLLLGLAYVAQLRIEMRLRAASKEYKKYRHLYTHRQASNQNIHKAQTVPEHAPGDDFLRISPCGTGHRRYSVSAHAVDRPRSPKSSNMQSPASGPSGPSLRKPLSRPPPEIGTIQYLFHRVGFMICLLNAILCVDPFLALGIFPLGVKVMFGSACTILIYTIAPYTIHAFMRINYEAMSINVPMFTTWGLIVIACSTSMVVLGFGVVQSLEGRYSWMSGMVRLWLAAATAVLCIFFDAAVWVLSKRMQESDGAGLSVNSGAPAAGTINGSPRAGIDISISTYLHQLGNSKAGDGAAVPAGANITSSNAVGGPAVIIVTKTGFTPQPSPRTDQAPAPRHQMTASVSGQLATPVVLTHARAASAGSSQQIPQALVVAAVAAPPSPSTHSGAGGARAGAVPTGGVSPSVSRTGLPHSPSRNFGHQFTAMRQGLRRMIWFAIIATVVCIISVIAQGYFGVTDTFITRTKVDDTDVQSFGVVQTGDTLYMVIQWFCAAVLYWYSSLPSRFLWSNSFRLHTQANPSAKSRDKDAASASLGVVVAGHKKDRSISQSDGVVMVKSLEAHASPSKDLIPSRNQCSPSESISLSQFPAAAESAGGAIPAGPSTAQLPSATVVASQHVPSSPSHSLTVHMGPPLLPERLSISVNHDAGSRSHPDIRSASISTPRSIGAADARVDNSQS